ncbi:Gnk2-homologous domain-containing protein [Dioscorea alata]|uniref:Gnk2-homologous domain-containing protein n=1 Tax=Dioscorea alata TaxID=55571 RepID=A0ACB7UNY2_DIOAL|nr:Gnk2-homologous domain-containing protein [Dioscorea alata]
MHSYMRSSSSLLLFSFIILVHNAIASDSLFNFCSNTNYTAGDAFSSNLDQLFFMLATKGQPTGFALGTVGYGQNKVNGLTLCRGDVKPAACGTCIRNSATQLRDLCPLKKSAIVWFDNCLLRYSDLEFFGQIDNSDTFYMWNVQNVSDYSTFNNKVNKLLNEITLEAYVKPSLFATGEKEIKIGGTEEKLYGLVQCTRDLSGEDCKKCLDGAISQLPSCCDGKRGGRVVGGSCNFRYELYSFYDV